MAPVIRPLMSVPVRPPLQRAPPPQRPPPQRQLPPPDDDIRVSGDVAEPEPEESQSSKPIVGIIYPPPEVRNIVDKTAGFVGRNGPEFEARIRQNEINNPKFNFLNSADPYHAYYRHKVKEFLEGKAKEPVAQKQQIANMVKPSVAAVQEKFVLKDPPPSYEFIYDPPSIAAYDLDIVRLTAQFVARNGRSFLTQLMQREAKNFQFDFLRPQHSLFQYFTKLVEQYTKILIPPSNSLAKLNLEIENPKLVLEEVKYRVEWSKHEDRLKEREQAEVEKEKMMYAQIDWHDFVVVETVDFQQDEQGNFPRPVKVDELGARLLQQERIEKYGEDVDKENQSDAESETQQAESEEEEESDEEEEVEPPEDAPSPEPVPLVAAGGDSDMEESDDEGDATKKTEAQQQPELIIRKDYNPKMKTHQRRDIVSDGGESYMISPITGEKIPATKMQDHMRYSLLDPNWKELKKKQIQEKQEEEVVFAVGDDIGASLRGLAERRTDIFGVEEVGLGQKVGEEPEVGTSSGEGSIQWDGFSGSMSKTQRAANEKVTVEEQLRHIQKTQGLLVDENLEKIGPQSGSSSSSGAQKQQPTPVPKPAPAPVPAPPQVSQPQRMQVRPAMQLTPVTPVMMRPMIPVQRQNPVLVVQQQMQPRPQLIAVQQPPPQMMMQHTMIQQPRMLQPMHAQQMQPAMNILPQQQDGPPQAKRARTEADLVPQDVFIQQNPGPVSFQVTCPNLPDKAEWNCHGQILNITLPPVDEVSVIKAKIHEATGMPAGKQKLQLDGLFIKDSNTLGYYNVVNGARISLQVKERGGRRK